MCGIMVCAAPKVGNCCYLGLLAMHMQEGACVACSCYPTEQEFLAVIAMSRKDFLAVLHVPGELD